MIKINANLYLKINKKLFLLNCDNFIIVCGSDETKLSIKEKLLFIECNDNYEGLPEKIIKTFSFITKNSNFNNYTHFCKLDEDMIINNLSRLT